MNGYPKTGINISRITDILKYWLYYPWICLTFRMIPHSLLYYYNYLFIIIWRICKFVALRAIKLINLFIIRIQKLTAMELDATHVSVR